MRPCDVPGQFSQPRQGPSGTPAEFTGYPERDRGTPTQLDTSAPISPASAEALIFFCLLFFYQEKKRRYSPACACSRKGINMGIRIQSFDPRGSSVGRMQYALHRGLRPSTSSSAPVPCRGHLWGVCNTPLRRGLRPSPPFSISFLDASKYIGRSGLFFR